MTLTCDVKAIVRDRAARDEPFRRALLVEALQSLMAGEVDVGQILLRDYVDATIGVKGLATEVNLSPQKLNRILSRNGNPGVRSLLPILAYLQQKENIALLPSQ